MDYRNQKSVLKENFEGAKRGLLSVELECASLRDVPLEDRRKEAKKPLYLVRYE